MTPITVLTDAVCDMVPDVLGMTGGIWRNMEPPDGCEPPWMIVTATTGEHTPVDTGAFTAHAGTLEIRLVNRTRDAVNVECDDLIIPTLSGEHPTPPGFLVGALTLLEDSGAYAAGLTAQDTARRWIVRVLRYRFAWSRL